MTRAREFSLGWSEGQANAGIWSRDFNANAYRLQMMNRFPNDWRDRQEVEVGGIMANLDFDKLSDAALVRISGGEPALSVLASIAESHPVTRELLGLPPRDPGAEGGPG